MTYQHFDLLEIVPNGRCDIGCAFCRLEKDGKDMTTGEVVANVRHFRRHAGIMSVLISGGEPTLRADFHYMLHAIEATGIDDIRVITTGSRFANRGFAEKTRISRAVVSFSPESRDELHGRQCAMTIAGIENLIAAGIPVQTNTVITRRNYRFLDHIADLLSTFRLSSAILTFPFPVGAVRGKAAFLAPSSDAVMPHAIRFVDTMSSQISSVILKGFPLCYLGEYARYTCRSTNRYYVDWRRQFDRAVPFFPSVVPFEHPEACNECACLPLCDGFWSEYLALPGFPPLQPLWDKRGDHGDSGNQRGGENGRGTGSGEWRWDRTNVAASGAGEHKKSAV